MASTENDLLDEILGMFEDQPREFSRRARRQYGEHELHTFVVEKPFCCPSRDIVIAALHPIGIPIFEITDWVEQQSLRTFAERMKIEMKTFENLQYGPLAPGFLPMACRSKFKVPASRANQAEYWLWRTRRLIVIDGEINLKNKVAAIKHNGKMPRASDPSKGQAYALYLQGKPTTQAPMLESTCTQAQALWDQVNKMAQGDKQRKARGKRSKGWFDW